MKNLNSAGFSHQILAMLFVLIFAVAGVAIVISHAQSTTGTINVAAYSLKPGGSSLHGDILTILPLKTKPVNGLHDCRGGSGGQFSTDTNIVCAPGSYQLTIYKNYQSGSFQAIRKISVPSGKKLSLRWNVPYKNYQASKGL